MATIPGPPGPIWCLTTLECVTTIALNKGVLSPVGDIPMQYDAEFCDAAPTRLKGIAMINVDDVEIGARELERCANLGVVGAMVTVYPPIGDICITTGGGVKIR